MEQYKQMLQHGLIHEAGWLKTRDIPFSQAVVEACAQNICGKYNSCWTCPPARGTLEQMRTELLDFENSFVFTYKGDLEDSFDVEGMNKAREEATGLLTALSARLHEGGVPHMRLGAGACCICPQCTYPGAPCRYPEKAINSIESCGVDVVTLAGQCGIRYHNGANTVTYFMAILLRD